MSNSSCGPPTLSSNKETGKAGNYYIMHQFIYLVEPSLFDSVDEFRDAVSYFEDYLSGNYGINITAKLRLKSVGYDCSIAGFIEVENKSRWTGGRGVSIEDWVRKCQLCLVEDWGYRPVFIGIVKLPNNGKKLQFRMVPSVIRLEVFNESSNTDGLVREIIPSAPIGPRAVANGETTLGFNNCSTRTKVEFPSDVIKCSSQIVGEISNNQTPVQRQVGPPLDNQLPILPRVVLGNGVYISLNESLDFTFERIKVSLCSTSLGACSV